MKNLAEYVKGSVTVEISGDKIERFINMCSFAEIMLWNLVPQKSSYIFQMYTKDMKRIRPILRKTRVKFRIIQKRGLPFRIYQYRKRYYFLLGMLLCVLLITFFSNILWEINIEGNQKESNEIISSYLSQINIRPGMKMSSIHCLNLSEKIREQFADIVWVSASTNGSKLLIQIKENETAEQTNVKDLITEPIDLIAKKDGVICKMITRKGTPQVAINDTVQAGQVLVSSYVKLLNDAKEVIGYEYQASDADIYAQTSIPYKNVIKRIYYNKKYYKTIYYPYFLMNNNVFGIQPNQNKDEKAEILDKRYHLIKNFMRLPNISIGIKIVHHYEQKEKNYTKKELQNMLNKHFYLFCMDLNKKGVQITSNSVKILIDNTSGSASGYIATIEPIATERAAEIKTIERKIE